MKKLLTLLTLLTLSACAVDKCNDYVVAYDCTEKYGTDCREHYLEMCETCQQKEYKNE